MPTIAEIRQKYPQYEDMSDTQLADALHKKYYSDMPVDEFAAKIGMAAKPAEAPAEVPTEQKPAYGWRDALQTAGLAANAISPTGFANKTGQIIAESLPGMLDSGVAAVTAPIRAYTGDLKMTDDAGNTSMDAIGESTNMALWATPSSPAMLPKALVPNLAEKAAMAAAKDANQIALAARNLDVTLPRAVTSDSAAIQQAGKVVSNIPIAGQPLRTASRDAIKQLDTAAETIQKSLGTGEKPVAGQKIRQSLSDFATLEEPANVSVLYRKVDDLVNPAIKAPLSETTRIASNISARRSNARLEGSGAVDFVSQALAAKDGMSYEDIKTLRTAIGELKKNKPELAARKIADSEIDAIYSGLSTDLRNAAQTAGGKEALKAFEEANTRARIFARDKEALKKIVAPDNDERVVSNIIAMAGTTARADQKTLMLAKSKVSRESWDELSSAAIADMGRDAEGQFTPDRFVTAWGKLSPSGKKLMFGQNPEHLKALEDLATVSSRFKQLNQYANPSGTAQSVLGGSYFTGLYVAPMTTISSLLAANATARLLARPASAKTVSEYVKAYELAARSGNTGKTAELLQKRARELSVIAANDAGNPAAANGLFTQLSTVQKQAANEENESGIRQPEVIPEADKARREFNDAVLAGRGA